MLRRSWSTLTSGGVTLLAVSSLLLGACGQQGALYLPTEAAAANRATLPQSLLPTVLTNPAAPPPASSASSAKP